MSRRNDRVDGVFTKLFQNMNAVHMNSSANASKETKQWEDLYGDLLQEIYDQVEYTSAVETIVMQRRVMDHVTDIKLGIQDDYIFAMCPFYRPDKKANDIRVYPGKITVYGQDLDALYKDPEFMERATQLLKNKMRDIIAETETKIENFNYIPYEEIPNSLN